MSRITIHVLTAGILASAVSATLAQEMTLLADPGAKSVWFLRDTDQSRTITVSEVTPFFDAANGSGVAPITNHSCLAARRDGLVVVGDAAAGRIVFLRDLNHDLDANDASEAIVVAGPGNASGVTISNPTGAAFDPQGRLFITNSGAGTTTTGTPDAVYMLVDLSGDGTFMGPGEITTVIGSSFFGTGNGIYAPQKLVFNPVGVGCFRNSSAGKHGVYRFNPASPGVTAAPTVFFDASNRDSLGAFTGFALVPDDTDARTLYTLQIATGSNDQILRLRDANANDTALDASEPKVLWQSAESNLTSYDLLLLSEKTFLVSDMTGRRIIALRDKNVDGDMTDAGERWDYLATGTGGIIDTRQMTTYRACLADYNADGSLDFTDVDDFIADFEAGRLAADVNADAALDFQDFDTFIQAFEGGC
ncbi:MAG: GC-type dockerin domain-anchored protein [Planctomycetota bacterium]|nr:GC-type dockerin domain-anchored protein [Planctomycetota bacterium]